MTLDRRAAPFECSEPVPGVRLVTELMPYVRSTALGLWVDVGARDEPVERAGTAHFLEHLLFKGTETRSAREIAEVFDAVGGEVNAYSAKEHTCFYARVLDSDLPMATDVLCDLFGNGALREEDISSERKVVLEEIHMSVDQPEEHVHDLFTETAWPDHPLGRPVIGTAETVTALDGGWLREFYRSGYTADRLVVTASGSVDHQELAAMLRERLEPGGETFRRHAEAAPAFAEGACVYRRLGAEQAHVVWGTESLSRGDPDRYALAVLNALYGGGVSSRLFQEVREERGLVYAIYSGYQMHVESGLMYVYAGAQPDDAADVLKIVREHAGAIASGALAGEEVGRAKGQVKGSLVLAMDDPGGRMARLGRAELEDGEIPTLDEMLGRVDAVTTEDVVRVAKRVFSGGGAVLTSVGPVREGALDFATEPLGQ